MHVCGRGLLESLEMGYHSGWIPPSGCLIDTPELSSVPRDQIVVLITGCQADYNSALKRLAERPFRGLTLAAGDTVIFSARFIPGNEKNLFALIASLEWQGVRVITPKINSKIHSSGHAYRDDIVDLLTKSGAKAFVPVHGSYSHLLTNANLVNSLAHKPTLAMIENGGVFTYDKGKIAKIGQFSAESIYIDGESNGQMTYEVMRDRMRIGEKGMVIATGVYSIGKGDWLDSPVIELIGIGFPHNSSETKCRFEIKQALSLLLTDASGSTQYQNHNSLNEEGRLRIRRALAKTLSRKPETFCYLHLVG